MSRRMADDLKRIFGIDNKSRPLEKRDPLPRVMGGYGVSIIEGETQPAEAPIYEPIVYALYYNTSVTGLTFSPDDNYGSSSGSFNSPVGTAGRFNTFAVRQGAFYYMDGNSLMRNGVSIYTLTSPDLDVAMICASPSMIYICYSEFTDNTVRVKGFDIEADTITYEHNYLSGPSNAQIFMRALAFANNKLAIHYEMTAAEAPWDNVDDGHYFDLLDLDDNSVNSTYYGYGSIPLIRYAISSLNNKFCFPVRNATASPTEFEIWVFENDPTDGIVIPGPPDNRELHGAVYTGDYVLANVSNQTWNSAIQPPNVWRYDLESQEWQNIHTLADFTQTGLMTVDADQQWESQQ